MSLIATPITNASHFREQIRTHEGLAQFLMTVHDHGLYIPFCKNEDKCFDALDHGDYVPEDNCLRCMMDWLNQEVDNEK